MTPMIVVGLIVGLIVLAAGITVWVYFEDESSKRAHRKAMRDRRLQAPVEHYPRPAAGVPASQAVYTAPKPSEPRRAPAPEPRRREEARRAEDSYSPAFYSFETPSVVSHSSPASSSHSYGGNGGHSGGGGAGGSYDSSSSSDCGSSDSSSDSSCGGD